jgi:hypothetical protein
VIGASQIPFSVKQEILDGKTHRSREKFLLAGGEDCRCAAVIHSKIG